MQADVFDQNEKTRAAARVHQMFRRLFSELFYVAAIGLQITTASET